MSSWHAEKPVCSPTFIGGGEVGVGSRGTSWGQQGGGRRRDRHSGFPRRPKFACLPFDGGHKAKFSVRGMLEVTGGTEKIDNVNTGCDHVLVNSLSLLGRQLMRSLLSFSLYLYPPSLSLLLGHCRFLSPSALQYVYPWVHA